MNQIIESLIEMINSVLNQEITDKRKALLNEVKKELKIMGKRTWTMDTVMELNTKLEAIKKKIDKED